LGGGQTTWLRDTNNGECFTPHYAFCERRSTPPFCAHEEHMTALQGSGCALASSATPHVQHQGLQLSADARSDEKRVHSYPTKTDKHFKKDALFGSYTETNWPSACGSLPNNFYRGSDRKRAVLHRLQTHSCLLHARIDRHPFRGGLLPNQLSLLHVSLRLKRRAAVTFVQSTLFSSLNLCAHVRSGSVRDTTHARRGGVIARSGNRKWPHVDWAFRVRARC
jgi:hypothetical protein